MSTKPQHGKNHPPANQKHGEREHDRPDKLHITNEPLRIEADFSPSVIEKYNAENREAATRERKKNRLEKWALAGLFIYCGLTFWLGWLTRQGVKHTQENFATEERAWISVTVDPSLPPQDGVQIHWPIHVNNVGKTFAKNIEGDYFAVVLNKGESPQFDYGIGHPHNKIYVGGMFPNETLPQSSVRVEKYGPKFPEPILMTKELRQAIANNESAIIVYGRITYDDIFGAHHWTQFCNGTGDALQLDNIKKCVKYNDADNNK